jgi:hypothetical protein
MRSQSGAVPKESSYFDGFIHGGPNFFLLSGRQKLFPSIHRAQKTLLVLFFLNNRTFLLSLITMYIQKRQITRLHTQIQIVVKCAQMIILNVLMQQLVSDKQFTRNTCFLRYVMQQMRYYDFFNSLK